VNVAIIGCGVEGSALAGLLVREDAVDQLLLVSRDGQRARALQERLHGWASTAAERCSSYAADAGDRAQLVRALGAADIVVQATLPETNPVVLEACLEVGAHYLDMIAYGYEGAGVPFEKTVDACLAFDERFRSADLLAISNTGASPGLNDLLARQLSEGMASVGRITVRWADRSDAPDLMPPMTADHIYTICMPSPTAWESGKLVDLDLFADAEDFEFPDPIGKMRMLPAGRQPDLRTIHEAVPRAQRIEVKIGLRIGRWRDLLEIWCEGVRRAYASGHGEGRNGHEWLISGFVPSAGYDAAIASGAIRLSAFGVAVTVEGELEGVAVRKTATMWTTLENARAELPWASAMSHLTAGTTVRELALMLCRGELTERGVVPSVGALTEADRVLASLEGRRVFRHDESEEIP
jgi:Saccharopine dehydrogenase NADP binding domain